MAIAIAIPLTFVLSPLTAIAFLVGINKGANFGGAISAVLINVPGAAEAIAPPSTATRWPARASRSRR